MLSLVFICMTVLEVNSYLPNICTLKNPKEILNHKPLKLFIYLFVKFRICCLYFTVYTIEFAVNYRIFCKLI